jgi:hypothetical protein
MSLITVPISHFFFSDSDISAAILQERRKLRRTKPLMVMSLNMAALRIRLHCSAEQRSSIVFAPGQKRPF